MDFLVEMINTVFQFRVLGVIFFAIIVGMWIYELFRWRNEKETFISPLSK